MQVYKGRLRSTGEEVAVKVQRPSISENIAIDMLLLRRFMTLVDARLPSLVDVSPFSAAQSTLNTSTSTNIKTSAIFQVWLANLLFCRSPAFALHMIDTARGFCCLDWLEVVRVARPIEYGIQP